MNILESLCHQESTPTVVSASYNHPLVSTGVGSGTHKYGCSGPFYSGILLSIRSHSPGDWRDGSVVKSPGCSHQESRLNSLAPMWWLETASNSGFMHLMFSLVSLGTKACTVHILAHPHVCRQNITLVKKRGGGRAVFE